MKQPNKRGSEINHSSTQQQYKSQFIYPLEFSDFNRVRGIDKLQYTIRDYHHLLKLKKMLENTENKMANRISLFRKASQRILLKKHKENVLAERIMSVRNSKLERKRQIQKILDKENYILDDQFEDVPFYQKIIKNSDKISKWTRASTPSIKNVSQSAKAKGKTIQNHIQKPQIDVHQIQQNLINLKISNAKNIKQERQRYKMIIAQRKKQQVNRNLKSAQNIRRNRDNTKIIKMQVQKQRRQANIKAIEEKVIRQKEQYIQLQRNLDFLQKQQREALIAWKKTLDA